LAMLRADVFRYSCKERRTNRTRDENVAHRNSLSDFGLNERFRSTIA
jgi:hypothetical protein